MCNTHVYTNIYQICVLTFNYSCSGQVSPKTLYVLCIPNKTIFKLGTHRSGQEW